MLELLKREELHELHVAAMEVLERIGIVMPYDPALGILEEAGATIDRKTRTARIPEHLVREAIKKTPSRVLLSGRNPKNNIVVGDGKTYYTSGFGATYTIDLETGQRRFSTTKDLEEFVLLSDYFPMVDYLKAVIFPQDVPRKILEQTISLAMYKYTEKNCGICALSSEGLRDSMKMAMILKGGEEEFRKDPSIINVGFNSDPPLKYSSGVLEQIIECAKYRTPFSISSGALAGATAPVTLAGTIVQGIAEDHAAVVLAQLVGPGTPILWGSCQAILDQRSGHASWGSPENGLINAAFCQVAHYYDIPYYGVTGVIDSKLPDAQAGYENVINVLTATLAGADVVCDAVYNVLETGMTASYETFAICNEMCSAIRRVSSGIRVDKETIALDIMRKVGPTKTHLTVPDALKFTKKHLLEEHWQTTLTDRTSRSKWEETGSQDIVQRAKEKVKQILATHRVEPLDKDLEHKMLEIIKDRAKGVH